jgi:hypothetical protein
MTKIPPPGIYTHAGYLCQGKYFGPRLVHKEKGSILNSIAIPGALMLFGPGLAGLSTTAKKGYKIISKMKFQGERRGLTVLPFV